MNYFTLLSFAIICANFTYIDTAVRRSLPLKTIRLNSHQRLVEVHDEYTKELLQYHKLLDETWNSSRSLVNAALDPNELPVQEVIRSAKENITKLTAAFDKGVADKCTFETEQVFRIIYQQASLVLSACITQRSESVLTHVLDVQDVVGAAFQRGVDNERNYKLCDNANQADRLSCQQKQIEILHTEQAAAGALISQAKDAIATANELPARLKQCTDRIVESIKEKVPEVVEGVKDCPKNAAKQ